MKLKEKYSEIKIEIDKFYLCFLNKKNTSSDSQPKPELIAVSKTFPSSMIEEVFGLGQGAFAENYVNEFEEKYNLLSHLPIKWHFIGHLQTNKVDKVVGRAELIQSVDSERLLKKIIDSARKKSIVQNILLQVKFGTEETKFGFNLESLGPIVQTYSSSPYVSIRGLMCILPLNISELEKVDCFSRLGLKLSELKMDYGLSDDFKELSMGMSDDFKLAILEGSTMIRIGSAIFGARK